MKEGTGKSGEAVQKAVTITDFFVTAFGQLASQAHHFLFRDQQQPHEWMVTPLLEIINTSTVSYVFKWW